MLARAPKSLISTFNVPGPLDVPDLRNTVCASEDGNNEFLRSNEKAKLVEHWSSCHSLLPKVGLTGSMMGGTDARGARTRVFSNRGLEPLL